MSAKTERTLTTLALLAALAVPASATSTAVADYLLTVERLALSFTEADLLANDLHGPNAVVLLQSGPGSGTLTCFDDGSCTYLPDVGFAGEDLFTYRVWDEGQVSPAAAVRIRVTPVVVPLVGDWNDDEQVDLGWFDSLCQTVLLAEINWGQVAAAPPVASQPPLPAGSMGWIPFAGDWDADGNDDVGVFDPLTRTYRLYVQDPPLPRGPLSAPTWTLHSTFSALLAGLGGLPVAGDWDAEGGVETGLYLPLAQQVALLDRYGDVISSVFFQAPPPSDRIPVAGDWGGFGYEPATVGLYSPSQRLLVVSDHQSVEPAHVRSYPDQPAGMLPFVADWTLGQTIGFYVPTDGAFGSFLLYTCDFYPGGCGGQQPLPIGPPPEAPLGQGCPLRSAVYGSSPAAPSLPSPNGEKPINAPPPEDP